MKILLDSCVWGGAADQLRDAGHDVVWAGSWDSDPGDQEILATAHREGRVLVTLDKDFGELAVVRELPHCGIIRLVSWRAAQQGVVCSAMVQRYRQDLATGALITVSPRVVRIRPGSGPQDGQ